MVASSSLELPFERTVEIVSLLASGQHRYEGRPADGPREPTGQEWRESIEVRAGLGIVGDRYQVVYHFTMGGPVDDPRLQTRPPYEHLVREKVASPGAG